MQRVHQQSLLRRRIKNCGQEVEKGWESYLCVSLPSYVLAYITYIHYIYLSVSSAKALQSLYSQNNNMRGQEMTRRTNKFLVDVLAAAMGTSQS